jgi:hypothetical protein
MLGVPSRTGPLGTIRSRRPAASEAPRCGSRAADQVGEVPVVGVAAGLGARQAPVALPRSSSGRRSATARRERVLSVPGGGLGASCRRAPARGVECTQRYREAPASSEASERLAVVVRPSPDHAQRSLTLASRVCSRWPTASNSASRCGRKPESSRQSWHTVAAVDPRWTTSTT